MANRRPPAPKTKTEEEAVSDAPAVDGQNAPTIEQVLAVLQRERRIRQQLEALNGALTGENIELRSIIAEQQGQ